VLELELSVIPAIMARLLTRPTDAPCINQPTEAWHVTNYVQ
jgi:hypothetical protein